MISLTNHDFQWGRSEVVITSGSLFFLDPSILKAPFSAQGTRLPVHLVPKKGREKKRGSSQAVDVEICSPTHVLCVFAAGTGGTGGTGTFDRTLATTKRWTTKWTAKNVDQDLGANGPNGPKTLGSKWCLFLSWTAGPCIFWGVIDFPGLEPRIPKWYTAMWKLHICHETLLGSRDPQASTLW